MATYNELKTDSYYLIKPNSTADIILVYVLMETEKAVFLEYESAVETLVWKKKSDTLEEIVEQLTEEQAELYESIVYEEEEDEEFSWEDLEEDDDEEDDDFTGGDDGDDGLTPKGGTGKTRKLFN
jgi:hypothetical protein